MVQQSQNLARMEARVATLPGVKGSLPAGWVAQWSKSRQQEYYSHPASGRCTWEFPVGSGEDDGEAGEKLKPEQVVLGWDAM